MITLDLFIDTLPLTRLLPQSFYFKHYDVITSTAVIQSSLLTHWGRATHICVSKLTIIVSDIGLSPGRRQAIIWTNAWLLLIGPLGTNRIVQRGSIRASRQISA